MSATLDAWLTALADESAAAPLAGDVARAATDLAGALRRCAPSQYRDKALCQLSDVAVMALVAVRQGPPSPQTQGDPS